MPDFAALGGHLNLPRLPQLSDIVHFVHRSILSTEHPSHTLVRRIPDSTTSSSSSAATSCTNNSDADTCAKPADTSLALPIGLGVAIPVGVAVVLLLYLHQRIKKKQRIEDRRDEEKYKSLDFGTSLHFADGKKKPKGGKGAPQFQDEAMTRRQMRGLSLEAGPYIFPDNLNDSRASLHSMSRNGAFDEFNPYRPADEMSIRAASPGPRMIGDGSSISSSTLRRQDLSSRAASSTTSHTNLLRHPQPPPKSLAPGDHSPYTQSPDSFEKPPLPRPLSGEFKEFNFGNGGLAAPPMATDRDSYFDKNAQNIRASTNYLGQFIHSREPSAETRNAPANNNPRFSFGEKPASYPSSQPDSTGSTLVNNTPSQTTPKASISEYDAPKIGVSDYDAPPQAIMAPAAAPKNEPLPSAKSLPSAKGLPSTPRPNRKPSVEQSEQPLPAPPAQPTPQRRVSPPQQQQQIDEYQQNGYPSRSSSNQHYSQEYPVQPRQSDGNYSNNYSNYQSNGYMDDGGNYGEYNPYNQRESSASHGSVPARGHSLGNQMPVVNEYPQQDQYLQAPPEPQGWADDVGYDQQRLSVFMRPLPPDDPNDTPEVRANRIRSFYKEYFDRGQYQGGPNGQYNGGYQQGAVPYPNQLPAGEYYDYEDYGQEYMNAATVYDPQQGGFVVGNAPYAEPVTRRAMTPPPRAPPRFRGNGPPSAPSSRPGSRPASNQTWNIPPRGGSSMSYRGRTPTRKPMPPPAPLVSLPTPHKLNADSVLTALDFAPPVSYRDRQAGRRPDSPLGVPRPYSPSVRAHTPLQSSFDDLAVIPSPHALRKSGVYTSLDFAPPRRIRTDGDNMSDAGSIRSGRSGMSAVSQQQVYAMRTGAYRVSRLPPELAGSKDDIMSALRPTWDLRGSEQAARGTGRDTPTDFKTLRFT